MRRTSLARLAPALALAGFAGAVDACVTSGTLDYDHGEGDASSDALSANGGVACPDAEPPAASVRCTGLYADFATKQVAAGAQAYAPSTPLWSDGAQKSRWIELPGAQIDATDPSEWTFPVGTKLFKEFRVGGKRVETRLYQKTKPGYWVHATYAWNADDTDAPISYGATVPLGTDGGDWIIPTPDDCEQCHRGRTDRILGFEQVGLGLPGATGLTLAELVAQALVTPPPALTTLAIGDDGTGLDAPALGWLHVNCGVTCHNANPGSSAYGAGMLLRLDPTLLDGRPVTSSSFDPLRTTVDVPCTSGSLAGLPRIVPGDPTASEIVTLISERGGIVQMPPIASRIVDTVDVAAVTTWIARLHAPPPDAGPPDAGPADAGTDAAPAGDAASEDASIGDASSADAGALDASFTDATLAGDAAPLDAGDAASPDAGADDAADDAGD